MKKDIFQVPEPRPAVANPELTRPDWTDKFSRDPKILWLDKNENTDPQLAAVIKRIVADIPQQYLYSYPESGRLYEKLAAHLGIEPGNLLLANGSDGAIRAAFEAYVSPGDRVIYSQPTFAMYAVYAGIYGAEAIPVEYRPSDNGPVLTAEEFIGVIRSSQPKMVCLPNPDSPTGTCFPGDELKSIIEAAGQAGALMLVDEAYYPFHRETVLPWVLEYPHLMVTRSTGKAWGLAGLRLGIAAAGRELATILHKVRPMYETNTVAVAVMERLLDYHDEMLASVKRLEAGKKYFLDEMQGLGFKVLQGHGNFLHVAFGRQAEKIHRALADIVYYRQDFNIPCLKGFSRFSATTPEQFRRVIDRIKEAIAEK